jgi:low affinity Fe/Cu permease
MKESFHKLAAKVSIITGTPIASMTAFIVIFIWALSGPIFKYSNTWQLVINTCTTIVTFLMVFLIQNTQNRDAKAMQLKLDELIRASKSARDTFIDLEDIADDELNSLDEDFKKLHNDEVYKLAHTLHKTLQAEKKRRRGVLKPLDD